MLLAIMQHSYFYIIASYVLKTKQSTSYILGARDHTSTALLKLPCYFNKKLVKLNTILSDTVPNIANSFC